MAEVAARVDLRIVAGSPRPEELALVTAVLAAATARSREATYAASADRPGWAVPDYLAPGSWAAD